MEVYLLAQVFAWCAGNVFYDAPNGNIVEVKGQPNISYSAVRMEKAYQKKQRENKIKKLLSTDSHWKGLT